MILIRILKLYLILGRTFKSWISPFLSGFLLLFLRLFVGIGRLLDNLLFWGIKKQLQSPIVIIGNPRSGTTFLHRFLIGQKIGTGSQLWQMLYPSVIVQKFIKPFLPLMERFSPAKHHSTEAHQTSLQSFETDDVSLLFRYLDGFFFYGFFLTFDDNDLFHWVDPEIRDTSKRDFEWFDSMWRRNIYVNKSNRYIGKLFSLSSNLPEFQAKYSNAKILYLVRDPLSVIPSGLSLVTGVLDKRFNFWSLDKNIRDRTIKRLYNAFVELLNRFHADWINDKINKDNVMIIRFDFMMSDFEMLMYQILEFIDVKKTDKLMDAIKITSEKQRQYKSKHTYNLEVFGLTENKIRKDCKNIYDTFLS